MTKLSALLVAVTVLAAACSSGDTSEQIEGVWEESTNAVVLGLDEGGQYEVAQDPDLAEPFEWGNYTFDGETLTMNAAPDSDYCENSSITWTVEFSDDGEQADVTFVEDSCTGAPRAQDMIWIRQSS